MGSYTELIIEDYPVVHSKSYVSPEVMTIFSEKDKLLYKRKISERNYIVWGNLDDDEEEMAYTYTTTVSKTVDRLNVMGFSLEKSKNDLHTSIQREIEDLRACFDIIDSGQQETIELLESSNLDSFIKAFSEIKEKQIPSYLTDFEKYNPSSLALYLIKDSNWILNYPCSDHRFYIRVFLESCDKNSLVIQDITEVTHAGYYSEEDNVRDNEVSTLTSTFPTNSKIIILTEGISDKNIIERSLALLYPHLSDYYSFMDFGLSNASGGASSLISQIKGFVGVGIKNKVIAILDNDTAAHVAKKGLNKTEIPDNISIIHYPYFDRLENYPTIGPTGEQSININEVAGSIEVYLGFDSLEINKQLTPVQWRGYDQNIGKYQGEVLNKDSVQDNFLERLKKCEQDQNNIPLYDWTGIRLILNSIFNAFN